MNRVYCPYKRLEKNLKKNTHTHIKYTYTYKIFIYI